MCLLNPAYTYSVYISCCSCTQSLSTLSTLISKLCLIHRNGSGKKEQLKNTVYNTYSLLIFCSESKLSQNLVFFFFFSKQAQITSKHKVFISNPSVLLFPTKSLLENLECIAEPVGTNITTKSFKTLILFVICNTDNTKSSIIMWILFIRPVRLPFNLCNAFICMKIDRKKNNRNLWYQHLL